MCRGNHDQSLKDMVCDPASPYVLIEDEPAKKGNETNYMYGSTMDRMDSLSLSIVHLMGDGDPTDCCATWYARVKYLMANDSGETDPISQHTREGTYRRICNFWNDKVYIRRMALNVIREFAKGEWFSSFFSQKCRYTIKNLAYAKIPSLQCVLKEIFVKRQYILGHPDVLEEVGAVIRWAENCSGDVPLQFVMMYHDRTVMSAVHVDKLPLLSKLAFHLRTDTEVTLKGVLEGHRRKLTQLVAFCREVDARIREKLMAVYVKDVIASEKLGKVTVDELMELTSDKTSVK